MTVGIKIAMCPDCNRSVAGSPDLQCPLCEIELEPTYHV